MTVKMIGQVYEMLRKKELQKQGAYLVNTIDMGDPTNLHPTNKKAVAERVVNWISNPIYKEEIHCQGPRFLNYELNRDQITINFDLEGDLLMKTNLGSSGIYVSSDGVHYKEAPIELSGKSVSISDDGRGIHFIKYAWTGSPYNTLYDTWNLPAKAFLIESKK